MAKKLKFEVCACAPVLMSECPHCLPFWLPWIPQQLKQILKTHTVDDYLHTRLYSHVNLFKHVLFR